MKSLHKPLEWKSTLPRNIKVEVLTQMPLLQDHLKRLLNQLTLPKSNQTLPQLLPRRKHQHQLKLKPLRSQQLPRPNQLLLRKRKKREHQRKKVLNRRQPMLLRLASRALRLHQQSLLVPPPRSEPFTEEEKPEPKLPRRELL